MRPLLFLICCIGVVLSKDAALETVSKHGRLSVSGTRLVNQNGEPVQLKGMSLFWSVWMPQYYNAATVSSVKNNCRSNVIRAAMTIVSDEDGGYVLNPSREQSRIEAVVDAAIAEDIYVIIDWHDHQGETHLQSAIEFFGSISQKYSGVPNVIYETYNEPITGDWSGTVKPYHETIIRTIRANDPNNLIIVGTPFYSQQVDQAANDPIRDQGNILYVLHFYAGTHKQWLRDTASNAMNSGIGLFVSEYGTVNADGDGGVDTAESLLWFDWLDQNNLSYVNWAISDKDEGASALVNNTTPEQVCQENYLTESGRLVVSRNRS